MPIVTCKKCGKPSRFAESDTSVHCPHCQAAIESAATTTKPTPAAAVVPPPRPKSDIRTQNSAAESPLKPANPSVVRTETVTTELAGPSASSAISEPVDTPVEATSSPSVRELLPPRYIDQTFPKRLLPPKYRTGGHGINSVGGRQAKGKVLIPDGQGGFAEVDERIVYVNSNGERIPVELTDRRTQWRQRAIFNLIAMLVCLAILYLSFLFIVPR
ncbi:MAG: hypothetical protein ABL888_17670 [Pirellulaceae bacterium]